MTVHRLDLTELQRFARGQLTVPERCRVVLLLLASRRGAAQGSRFRLGDLAGLGGSAIDPGSGTDYASAFERNAGRLDERAQDLHRERERLDELIRRLEEAPPEERRALLRGDRAFHLWAFADWLVDACLSALEADPARAEDLADLAVGVAESLDSRTCPGGLIADMKARAWASVGETLRVLSDLRSADEAFATAQAFLAEGSGDPLEEARVLELQAALRSDQRKFGEAHRMLDAVITLTRRCRDFHLVGRAFVQKGRVYGAANDLEAAIRWVRKGLGLIDSQRDRAFDLAARQSLMLYLQESGRSQEAWFLLKAYRADLAEHGGNLLRLHVRWLEGKIHESLHLLPEAEAALEEARQGFVERGVGFAAALVSLDLAGLYARQNRLVETRRIAEEMFPIFRSRDVHREAIAALIVFQQAARLERVDEELLKEIRSYLRKARKDHQLRFVPSAV